MKGWQIALVSATITLGVIGAGVLLVSYFGTADSPLNQQSQLNTFCVVHFNLDLKNATVVAFDKNGTVEWFDGHLSCYLNEAWP